jgi:hypothetical protein
MQTLNRISCVLAFVCLFGQVLFSQDDRTSTALVESRDAFEASFAAAKQRLLSELEKKLLETQRAGNLKLYEQVSSQIKAFREKNERISLLPMDRFDADVKRSFARMHDAYQKAIKAHTKNGEIAQAKSIQGELENLRTRYFGPVDSRFTWAGAGVAFRRTAGKTWKESHGPGNDVFEFVESVRNSEYVELRDESRKISVRLFKDKSSVRQDGGEWHSHNVGQWQSVSNTLPR